ncbi:unnamed protein product [Caenorhabditis auriculariae]|uniref:Acyltransferase 3 domain-containing protein n=1 Tax=Caenorhabditis auriculariae TaxID=2777116 RepID=A0A8S1HHC3_9PELO|nr:unnamed protein product [Caenorhabditis auriculariae]
MTFDGEDYLYSLFFVLSGFLMCMLLQKSQTMSRRQLVLNFYCRRLKRILPLYLLCLLGILLALYVFFPDSSVDTNLRAAPNCRKFNTTLLTGLLICAAAEHPILCSRPLIYLGDISYALYLIHWPICAYCKLVHPDSTFAVFIGFLASILTAVVVRETFEK